MLIIIIFMNKTFIFIGLALLVSFALAQTAPCPLQSEIGSLISARVIVARQQSLVALVEGTDVQCYNYSLPYSFTTVPDVAVAVHDFESRPTNDLFFSIKPIYTESLAFVPFLIRTHWKYTAWTKMGFSFLAEDRTDLEAGYYQVDSGMLGGCEPGKSIQVLLPFRRIGLQPGNINHNLFLHGFEISVQRYNTTTLSPFEIQLVDSSTNSSGIAVLISVTTVTQVQAIHISYLAWAATTLQAVVGSYVYDANPSFEISHTPVTNIGRNYARLHGITGFIINYNSNGISLSTTWTGSKFVFDFSASQRLVQYFSYRYIFFIGSECSDCPGYVYTYNGRCVAFCPAGSYPTAEKTCIECGQGYFWDGEKCRKLCPEGQYLNIATNECECPAGMHWTGKICLNCLNGRQFNQTTLTCECPAGTRWNGYSCASFNQCTNGKEWDIFTFTCKCPVGTVWNGTFCFKPTICRGGQFLDSNYKCVCPENTFFKDGICQQTGCTGGQIWNGSSCVCDTGFNWNGTYCLLCINGQDWDTRTRSCRCPDGKQWNGNFCEKFLTCTGGRVYNREYEACLCPDKNYWNGAECKEKPNCCCGQRWNEKTFRCDCPEGFNWDGRSCVVCTSGKTFDNVSKTCVCPPGTQWNNQFCTVIENCRGGMIWNQNTWACECPSVAVWNGNYCISNPCVGGKVWDNLSKTCICLNNYQFLNGKCIPPEIYCTYGRVLNITTLKCQCPNGTWDSGTSCDPKPVCESNKIYNQNNNRCQCQSGLVWLTSKLRCGDPTCPSGQRWDGFSCVDISCPPNSYFNGTECICPNPQDYCLPWEYYNGFQCVYFKDSCPKGTRWNSTVSNCVSTGECPQGFYRDGTDCKPLPQRCLPPTQWTNGKCSGGGNCPYGTYKAGNNCQPMNQCSNGQIWNSNLLQCICPENTGWNGQQCVTCGGGQVWNLYEGCQCPPGQFFRGDKCESVERTLCDLIPYAKWQTPSNRCVCNPGFSIVGLACICRNGVPYEHFCDRCAHRPNSEWRFGICQCAAGYTLYGTECLPNQQGDDRASDCSVGTFFDQQQKKCLACPTGCLSCTDSYTCGSCFLDFDYDISSSLCLERCGDGVKYRQECDDGDNDANDGCSTDCRVEPGWICRGGSPTSRDLCEIYNPASVTIIQTGQVRYATKIVINLKVDYLPPALLQSLDCRDRCSGVLTSKLTGETAARVKSSFLSGTNFAFTMEIEFDRPYIARFNVEIGISPSVASYFGAVSISNKLNIEINPAFLAKIDSSERQDFLN